MRDYTGANPGFSETLVANNATLVNGILLFPEGAVFGDSLSITDGEGQPFEAYTTVIPHVEGAGAGGRIDLCYGIKLDTVPLTTTLTLHYQSFDDSSLGSDAVRRYVINGAGNIAGAYYSTIKQQVVIAKPPSAAPTDESLQQLLAAIDIYKGAVGDTTSEDLTLRLARYQQREDDSLETVTKSIEGAVAELNDTVQLLVDQATNYQAKTDYSLQTDKKTIVGAINDMLVDINDVTVPDAQGVEFGGCFTEDLDVTGLDPNSPQLLYLAGANGVNVLYKVGRLVYTVPMNKGDFLVYYQEVVYMYRIPPSLYDKQDKDSPLIPTGSISGALSKMEEARQAILGIGKYTLHGLLTANTNLNLLSPVVNHQPGYWIVTAASIDVQAPYDDGATTKTLSGGSVLVYDGSTVTVEDVNTFPVARVNAYQPGLAAPLRYIPALIDLLNYQMGNITGLDLLLPGGYITSNVTLPAGGVITTSLFWEVQGNREITGDWSTGDTVINCRTGDLVILHKTTAKLYLLPLGTLAANKQSTIDAALAPTGITNIVTLVKLLEEYRQEMFNDHGTFMAYLFVDTDLSGQAFGQTKKWWYCTGACVITVPNTGTISLAAGDYLYYDPETTKFVKKTPTIPYTQPGIDLTLPTQKKSIVGAINELSELNTGGGRPAGSTYVSYAPPVDGKALILGSAPVSRTDYPDLFNAIGTRYGDGDGSTTFNLPSPPFPFSAITTKEDIVSYTTAPIYFSIPPYQTSRLVAVDGYLLFQSTNSAPVVFSDEGVPMGGAEVPDKYNYPGLTYTDYASFEIVPPDNNSMLYAAGYSGGNFSTISTNYLRGYQMVASPGSTVTTRQLNYSYGHPRVDFLNQLVLVMNTSTSVLSVYDATDFVSAGGTLIGTRTISLTPFYFNHIVPAYDSGPGWFYGTHPSGGVYLVNSGVIQGLYSQTKWGSNTSTLFMYRMWGNFRTREVFGLQIDLTNKKVNVWSMQSKINVTEDIAADLYTLLVNDQTINAGDSGDGKVTITGDSDTNTIFLWSKLTGNLAIIKTAPKFTKYPLIQV